MNEYEAIAVYAAFALGVFGLAVIWRHFRHTAKKRFRLLNYSKGDDGKTPHVV